MIYPLFIKTCYSLLDSCISPQSLVEFAIEHGYECIGIADRHNMHSVTELARLCDKNSIKLIIGAEVSISESRSCLIYAMNNDGYKYLSHILTSLCLSEKSEISIAEIYNIHNKLNVKVNDICIILLPGIQCHSKTNIIDSFGNELNHYNMQWYVGCDVRRNFGEAAYMSSKFEKSVIAITEAAFLKVEDQIAHDILLCIKHKKYLADPNRVKSMSLMKILMRQDYERLYIDLPFCLENTKRFCDKVNVKIKFNKPMLPEYGIAEIKKLKDMAHVEFENKIQLGLIPSQKIAEYKERLDYEITEIDKMGFISYFLIVADFVHFAKHNNIPVGPGRGSGVGSIVAWCLKITDIDPIKFDLIFERFLNPGRVSMPDFDIDFGPQGRARVIEYVKNKYGEDCVAGIVTFGSLSSRAVLKDVGRVMHIPYSKIDALSKRIQVIHGRVDSLEETYEKDDKFRKDIDNNEDLKNVFRIAKKLEGLPRHISAHAAGIIITQYPIADVVPLIKDEHISLPLTQVNMKNTEALGLIKYDFLGLTALEIIQDCFHMVNNKNNKKLDWLQISYDDEATFELLNNGLTAGIFQFEGPGMTRLISDVDVSHIEDLIAIVSLYRPGPMDNIPLFLKHKKDVSLAKYIYPGLKEILKNTYGVIIYQEQIIKIAQEIAGFSLSEADLLRRSMGKKNVREMRDIEDDFVRRTHEKQGGDIQIARDFFQKQVWPFAQYGFNKAHATAYAIIGYIMAYLKAHYTVEFITVSMTYEQFNSDKLQRLVYDAKKMQLKILAPDINRSDTKFSVVNNQILYSLSAIKNVGTQSATKIREECRKNGPFKSLNDFQIRIGPNKRELESLSDAGCFDGLDKDIRDDFILFE